MDANDYQIGGDHYKIGYEHWDFVIDTKLHYLLACATKYIARWRAKNGIEDLKKAPHYLAKADEACIKAPDQDKDHMLYKNMSRFINQLNPDDGSIIHAIMLNDFALANRYIEQLILEVEAAEANSAYTNQE